MKEYKKNILVVDDTIINIDIIVELLENDYDLLVAIDGEGAIEIASDEKIDLILLDIMMPNMDGYEVCQILKSDNRTKNIPIIFITAKTDDESIEKAFLVGGVDYITKPFRAKEMKMRVSTHLALSKKDKMLQDLVLERSKLASVGEMVDSIAHQWIQPLNIISTQMSLLYLQNLQEKVTSEYIQEHVNNQTAQIQHLLETLNEFRNFFRPNNNFEIISYKKLIDSVLLLLNDNLTKYSIQIKNLLTDGEKVKVIPNQFKHTIINMINNAIDIFKIKEQRYRKLTFCSTIQNNYIILHIQDNAGGIPTNIIDKIFEANFTTKSNSQGTGMGLYMSSMIIEKIGGEISVQNQNSGAEFSIKLPIYTNQKISNRNLN